MRRLPTRALVKKGRARPYVVGVQARSMRQSVDVTRLSRIALSNLEREGDGSDYTAVEMQPGDVRIETADAELDFVDERDEGAAVLLFVCARERPPSACTAGCVRSRG